MFKLKNELSFIDKIIKMNLNHAPGLMNPLFCLVNYKKI